MVGEVEKRPLLAVLLALEEERRLRGEQRHRGPQAQLLGARPVAQGAVADLVVVLRADDQPFGRSAFELRGEALERAVAGVVAVPLACEEDVQLVMELVRPLRVVAPRLDRTQVAGLGLGDDQRRPGPLGQLGQDVAGRVVEDGVGRVEPEPVDAVVAHPQLGVLDRPLAHRRLRVVDRVAPEGLVPVGEVGAEGAQGLVPRADVVVDDVEDDPEAFAVRGVDEARQALRPAVCRMWRPRVEPVVAPAALAREGRDRHQLDRGDAELAQLAQARDHPVERAFRAERADVQLVQHELLEREPVPGGRRRQLHDRRRAANTVRLPAGARVGPRLAVDDVDVLVAVGGGELGLPDTVAGVGEFVLDAVQAQPHRIRRPATRRGSRPTPPRGAWPRACGERRARTRHVTRMSA